jgi:hypothetical protein
MSKRSFFFLAAAILTGCGGGGADTSAPAPTATATITSSNAIEVAGATTDAALTSTQFDELADFGGLFSQGGMTMSASDASVTLAKKTAQLQATTGATTMAVSVGPETTACPLSGTMTISATIENPETLTVGDSFSLSYLNCDLGDGIVANGGIGFTVSSFNGDLTGGSFDLGFNLQINQLQLVDSIENVTMNGDLSLSLNEGGTTASVALSGVSLSVTNGVDSYVLSDFSTTATVDLSVFPEAFTLQSSGFLMSSAFDGEVQFSTTVALQGSGEDNPLSGEFLITGADSATIKVIPLDSLNVRLELDLDGDQAVDANGMIDMTWQELLDTTG